MIAWFARNGVAANLLMFLIVGLGLFAVTSRTPLEVFPSFALDVVNISFVYPGATPEEVEDGVLLRVEEAIHDLEGIEEIVANAAEGGATISVEVATGTEPRELMDELKNRVDAISTFPAEVERPVYQLAESVREVISVAIAGNLPERDLRSLAERVRDELVALPAISQVELQGVRDYEVSIEIPSALLESYDLTLDEVAEAVRRSSLDLSAGQIRTRGGDILLRTRGQAFWQLDFENIVLVSRTDGTRLTLGDIATVRDGFSEDPLRQLFNGRPGALIEVYRTRDQSAIRVADAVKAYVAEQAALLPPGIELSTWRDRSRIVKARLATLTNSAMQGGVLIFLLLALFLRFSVAVWVCVGIPVSFMGALALMPELGLTINIVSLFAFILVLGIVVDDAIVTGENIYRHLKVTGDPTRAAIEGTHEVAVPVTFGVLTTAAAFVPLLFMEGARGQIFAQIPAIVIPVLLFSLVESKLILPAHMKHLRVRGDRLEDHGWPVRMQHRFADGFERLVLTAYRPLLDRALQHRYLTWSVFVGALILVFSIIISGHLRFVFFPRVQSETARATLEMAAGTPFEVTDEQILRITDAARALRDRYVDPQTGESVIMNILSTTGSAGGRSNGANVGRVMFEIVSPENRSLAVTSSELVREWRAAIGQIPGAKELSYRAEIGRAGAPLDVELVGRDPDVLDLLAEQARNRLAQYPGVFDISDTASDGKQQIELRLREDAELLGIDVRGLARQVRNAFYGAEAQRIQRGRNDVRVMIRYPEQERRSLGTLEQMRIVTSSGTYVPLSEVAELELGQSYSAIRRVDRERVLNVSADLNKETADIEGIKRDLQQWLPELLADYPGHRASLVGEAEEQRESFTSLYYGTLFVLFVIYALLAIPFRSYFQPLIVMSVIPFGLIGAVLGHLLLGMDLSILSFMGMLALSGVVVNDSLVLVDYVNQRRAEGMAVQDAILTAGVARFRAVILTSLTTFVGLVPLIFEKSTQAQFLIPMGVSLGFGVLFATLITLILIPVNYAILEDAGKLLSRQAQGGKGRT